MTFEIERLQGPQGVTGTLRESDKCTRNVADFVPAFIYLIDPNGRPAFANRSLLRFLGLTGEEFSRVDPATALHPHDWQRCYETFLPLMSKRQPVTAEFRAKGAVGEYRWFLSTNEPSFSDQGEFLGYCGTCVDITERKRIDEHTKFQAGALSQVSDAIIALDNDQTITYWNAGAERLYGFKEEEVLGKPIEQITHCPWLKPEKDGLAGTSLAMTGSWHGKNTHLKKSGEEVFVESSVSTLTDDNGGVIGLLGIIRDITERKGIEKALRESEERFRQIAENVQDVVWMVDSEFQKTLYLNPAFERIWGWPADKVYARLRSFTDAVYPEDRAIVFGMVKQRASGVFQTFEYRIIRPDGSIRWLRDRSFPIRNSEGKIYRTAGIAEDITEQKLVEEEVRTYSRRLVEAQESERKRIARELHDEIGQVLTAVRINLQNLLETPGHSNLQLHFQENVDVIDEALNQVRNLALELRPSLLDDLGLCAALRWYVDRQARRQHLRSEIRIHSVSKEKRLPAEVETACFRIVQEALTNIGRHASARNVWVELKQRYAKLHLSIKDDGVGIDMDQIVKRKPANLTLGLKGMRERALAVGGHLEIRSTLGTGTQILGTFPIGDAKGKPDLFCF